MAAMRAEGNEAAILPVAGAVDSAVWPALPGPNGMALASLLLQFAHNQWLPAEAIAANQAGQLACLLAHAQATVPFYRDRLPTGIAEDGPSTDAWRAIPLLTRREIQAAGATLQSVQPPTDHGSLSEIFTSGSTGTPVRAVRTQLAELYWSAFTLRDHLWHRRDLGGTLAAIRESKAGKAPWPDGTRWSDWGSASAGLFRTGPCVSLNIMTPIDRQLDWLRRQDPDYLISHPTNIARLAQLSLETGIKLPRLREVQTIAEVLNPQARSLIADAWGATVSDIYSARETGYLALQCPEAEQYHVQAEGVLVEVLDDDDSPCKPGHVGRVVVTTLQNFAMPLIRYDIGDRAEVGQPCPCGRGLPVLARIMGREQNLVQLPDGSRRWALLSSGDIARLTELAPIRQYQFAQRAADRFEVRLATARPLSPDEETAIADWLRRKFDYPFAVTFSYLDEIPRSPAGKFEDFISEIAPDAPPDQPGS